MGHKKKQEPRKEPAADLDAMDEWFSNTVQQEQEEQEDREKAFAEGEGIELPLND
jgi:hypothetical protein